MLISERISLSDFNFWNGAKRTAEWLTADDFDIIDENLSEIYMGRTVSRTDVNNFFWFEDDTIAEWLGYSDFDDLMANRKAESNC